MGVTQSNLHRPADASSASEGQAAVSDESAADKRSHLSRSAAPAPAISVVLPAYNEQQMIGRTFAAVMDFARRHRVYEFIFVDDGSTDQTAAILRKLIAKSESDQIRLVSLKQNMGKGGAMKRGFEDARGKLVIFTDGDLAYSLDHLPRMAGQLDEFDMVIGSRQLDQADHQNNRRPLARTVLGEGFNSLARFIMGLPYRDTQAGLKGFRREAASLLFPRTRVMRYCTDVELLFLAHKLGLRVGEMPARVDPSHAAKPTSMNLFGDPPRMFADMMRIRWNSVRGRYD